MRFRRLALLSYALTVSAALACSYGAVERQHAAPPPPAATPQQASPGPPPPEPRPPAPEPVPPEPAAAPPALTVEAVLTAINASRTQNRLPPLVADARLSAAAESKLADMVKRDYVDHADPDGRYVWPLMQEAGCRYRAAAENLGTGFTDAERLEQAWMKSPVHRDNILDRRNGIAGIAVALRPKPLVVVLFADSCG